MFFKIIYMVTPPWYLYPLWGVSTLPQKPCQKNKKNLNHRGHREHRERKSISVSSVLSMVGYFIFWIVRGAHLSTLYLLNTMWL
jgi:hypothetical protein